MPISKQEVSFRSFWGTTGFFLTEVKIGVLGKTVHNFVHKCAKLVLTFSRERLYDLFLNHIFGLMDVSMATFLRRTFP